MGRVTRSHFSRLLSINNLNVSDDDLHILFKKYEDRTQGKVNYMEFIRTIDQDTYVAYNNSLTGAGKTDAQKKVSLSSQAPRLKRRSIVNIVQRIRNHVSARRVRISEFFRDFDKLRSYSIRRDEFLRGITQIGVDLSETDHDILAEHYKDEKKAGCCRWKQFEDDVEKVFGETHLENRPTYVHQHHERKSPYTVAKKPMTVEETALLQAVLNNFREKLKVRQSSVKPFFRDFDKVCSKTGHVTKSQFRQCLTYMKCDVTEEEFAVLCKRWTKSETGIEEWDGDVAEGENKDYIKSVGENINYILFLQELENGMDEDAKEEANYEEETEDVPSEVPATATKSGAYIQPTVDEEEFEKLMMRMKIKVRKLDVFQQLLCRLVVYRKHPLILP